MNNANVEMDKWQYRKDGLQKRRDLDRSINYLFSQTIADSLLEIPVFQKAKCVFCYASMADEVQTVDLLNKMLAEVKKVCIPLILKRGHMNAARVPSVDDFEEGKYGILTVKEDKQIIVDPEEIDCAIIPGTAFGRDGSRVGMGGGFYDRFLLKAKNATRIGICFEFQISDTVPVEKHDLFMDMIITEKAVYKRMLKGTE